MFNSVYILNGLLSFRSNYIDVSQYEDVYSMRRQKPQNPIHRLKLFESRVHYSGLKLYNRLPYNLKKVPCIINIKKEKKKKVILINRHFTQQPLVVNCLYGLCMFICNVLYILFICTVWMLYVWQLKCLLQHFYTKWG